MEFCNLIKKFSEPINPSTDYSIQESNKPSTTRTEPYIPELQQSTWLEPVALLLYRKHLFLFIYFFFAFLALLTFSLYCKSLFLYLPVIPFTARHTQYQETCKTPVTSGNWTTTQNLSKQSPPTTPQQSQQSAQGGWPSCTPYNVFPQRMEQLSYIIE